MDDKNDYKLPNIKKEASYYPYRCLNCWNILRIKIYFEEDVMCLLISCKCGIISKVRDKSLFLSEGNNMKDIKLKLNITNDDKQEKKICDNICQIHKEKFIGYCKECDKDICQKCIDLKTEHKLINSFICKYYSII